MRRELIIKSIQNRCVDESSLQIWVADQTKPDNYIIDDCLKMIELLDKAKLYHVKLWPVWYQRIVKAYCAIGDKKNAKKFAEKAAKLSRMYVQDDGGWDAVARDPKDTDWWGARTKARKGNRAGEALDITFEHQTPEMHEQADKFLVAYVLTDEELEGFDKLLQSSNQTCVGRL